METETEESSPLFLLLNITSMSVFVDDDSLSVKQLLNICPWGPNFLMCNYVISEITKIISLFHSKTFGWLPSWLLVIFPALSPFS